MHQQTETNWSSFFTLLPAGGRVMLVVNSGRDVTRIVRAIDTSTGNEIWNHATDVSDGDPVPSLDPTGRWCAYREHRGLRLIDVSTGSDSEAGFPSSADPSPDGEWFACCSVLFNRRQPDAGVTLGLGWGTGSGSTFSPSGKYLACGTHEGLVLLADVAEVRRRLEELEHH
jgi:hypothetical protein